MHRPFLGLALAMLLAGCSSAPVRPPRFEPDAPTGVQGRVVELRPQGAWIELVDYRFISYDSVVVELSAPAEASGSRAHLQYQGAPVVNGRTIEVGQTISFTLPAVAGDGCCEPYLEDMTDLEVLADP